MGSSERLHGREHIPRYPRGWIVLHCFQLVFCILIIGLSAYSLSIFPAVGPILAMLSAVITLAVSIWLISAHSCAPKAYNYWAALVLDIFLYIFWLVSFALCAVEAAALLVIQNAYCDNYYEYYNDSSYYNANCSGNGFGTTLGAIVAAMSGLGALEFLFFFISWVTDAVVIHRHRRAGLHNKPSGKPGSAAGPYQVQMQPQFKSNYEAVPQQGIPFQQQDTSYNPQSMYNPPTQGFPPQQASPQPYYQNNQQGFYQPAAAPIAPQPTGSSLQTTASPPPQGGYQAPYQQQPSPHQQQPSPHQQQPYAHPPPVHSPAPYPPQQGY